YDVTHTFTSNWIYALPFAKDKMYGGWSVSGILYVRSGLPFTVTQTQAILATANGNANRPNRIPSGVLSNPTIAEWFDINAFVAPTDTTAPYGNSGRNILRGPGQTNVDFSLIKTTRFGHFENEFRIEAFNLFIHPQFANPSGGALQLG